MLVKTNGYNNRVAALSLNSFNNQHLTKLLMDDQKLLIAITEVSGTVKALHGRFDRHEADFTKRQDKIEETLYGNGRPGLTTSVQVIETKHDSLVNRLKIWVSIGSAIMTAAILTYFGLS